MSFNILSGMMMIYGSRQHMHFIKRKKETTINWLFIYNHRVVSLVTYSPLTVTMWYSE